MTTLGPLKGAPMFRFGLVMAMVMTTAAAAFAAALPCGGPRQVAASYVSSSGKQLEACFDRQTDTVTLRLADAEAITLPVAVSASGARYSDERRTFWEHHGVGRYYIGEALLFEGRPVEPSGYNRAVKSKVVLIARTTADGRAIAYPVTTQPEVTVLTVELPPGAATGWHKHQVPVYAYLLAGTLNVELENGKTFSYQAGDAVVEVVGVYHNGINRGSEPVRLVVVYTGVQGVPNTVKRP